MGVDALLERLQGVRRTGEGRYLARCPAHQDKSPSLSVRELDSGVVLLHCFASCSVEEVLRAVGLDFDALFPPRPTEQGPRLHAPFPAADVLRALADELMVVAVIVGDVEHGRVVSVEDFTRLRLARERIEAGRRLALGER
jgi:hypothetical protein